MSAIQIYFYHDEKLDLNKYRASINVKLAIGNEFDNNPNKIAQLIISELQSVANSIEDFRFFHDDYYLEFYKINAPYQTGVNFSREMGA